LKSISIADTGLIIALLNPHDLHHDWAKVEAKQCPAGFITCEAVISETVYLLRKSKKAKDAVIAMIESGWINIVPVLPEMRVGVIRILETYHPFADYADACLVALHEQYGSTVYTTDRRDFTVYRTRSGELVSAVFPKEGSK
jgi:predicted nucleic acid-binding protein